MWGAKQEIGNKKVYWLNEAGKWENRVKEKLAAINGDY
jgi:hypothetical protein